MADKLEVADGSDVIFVVGCLAGWKEGVRVYGVCACACVYVCVEVEMRVTGVGREDDNISVFRRVSAETEGLRGEEVVRRRVERGGGRGDNRTMQGWMRISVNGTK